MLSSLLIASFVVGLSFAQPESIPWLPATGPSSEIEEAWADFKINYDKTFVDENEESAKKEIFAENLKAIDENNYLYSKGLKTFTMKVNQFADMNQSEFLSLMTGYIPSKDLAYVSTFDGRNLTSPKSLDWRSKGYVTRVKNQGRCGSCWAFSATGALEGQHFRAKGKLVSLSEQQLVDCSKRNHGCKGGWTSEAFEYVAKNRGIAADKYYPYTGKNGSCRYKESYIHVGAKCRKYVEYKYLTEHKLQSLVSLVGPLSVAIDASQKSFQFYESGVYYEPHCKKSFESLNHTVLLVGYGKNRGKYYWIVKNSWGTDWGKSGYIWMARNRKNNCGIASDVSYPVV